MACLSCLELPLWGLPGLCVPGQFQVDEEATPTDLEVTSEGFATAVGLGKRLLNGLLGAQSISADGVN